MTNHQKINNTLVKVEYSNGCYIVINYSNEKADYNGKTIEAESYILGKE